MKSLLIKFTAPDSIIDRCDNGVAIALGVVILLVVFIATVIIIILVYLPIR